MTSRNLSHRVRFARQVGVRNALKRTRVATNLTSETMQKTWIIAKEVRRFAPVRRDSAERMSA